MSRQGIGPWRWVALLLFGYVLARPVSTNVVLVPVLAGIGALAVGTLVVARRRLVGPLVPAAVVTFVFALVGLAAGPTNPGFWGAVLVFVAAPLLFWLVTAAVDERLLRGIFTTAAVVTVFIGVTIAVYAAQNTGSLPTILPDWLLQQGGAGFGGLDGAGLGGSDYTEVRFYGLSTLVATGPMWVASLFVTRDSLLPPLWLRVAAAVAATAGTLAGGRRALALVLVLTPLLVWLIKIAITRAGVNRPPVRGRGILLVAALAIALLAGFAPRALSGGVIEAAWQSVASYVTGTPFVGANAGDDRLRTYTADRLLEGWSDSPIFGQGFGATIQNFARDYEEPWRWELQYHALLFQTGIVGALLVLAGFLLTLNAVVRAARARPDLTPGLVVACTGAMAMLLGNASNPYLQAPGHVWAIFLPVALANVMLGGGGSGDRRRSAGPGAGADELPPLLPAAPPGAGAGTMQDRMKVLAHLAALRRGTATAVRAELATGGGGPQRHTNVRSTAS